MKRINTKWIFLLTLLAVISCSDDDNGTPDPRLELVGSYTINDIDITLTQGTVTASLDLTTNAVIQLFINDEVSSNQMAIELEDFLEETILAYYEFFGDDVFINVTITDKQLVTIQGNRFEIRNLDYEMSVLYDGHTANQYWVCETSIVGSVSGDTIDLTYFIEGHVDDINSTFEGTAIGVLLE